MGEFREKIPKVKPGQKTKYQDELVMLNELLQVRHKTGATRFSEFNFLKREVDVVLKLEVHC